MNPYFIKFKRFYQANSGKINAVIHSTALIFLCFLYSCSSNQIDDKQREKYTQQGAKAVSEVHGYLNAQLHQFLDDGDTQSAIFGACNLNIVPKIDSLVHQQNIRINRVSNLCRNPKNKPSKYESEILNSYESQSELTDKPMLQLVNNRPVYFSPIFVNETCLKCHGEKEKNLDSKSYEIIKSLYPEDKAINYKNQDLIGMWAVTFLEKL